MLDQTTQRLLALFAALLVLPLYSALNGGNRGYTLIVATYERDLLLSRLLEHVLTPVPVDGLRNVLVVWQNTHRGLPPFLDSDALDAWRVRTGIQVHVRRSERNSMNERFRPYLTSPWCKLGSTGSTSDEMAEDVLVLDDDVVLHRATLEWAYKAYLAVGRPLSGFSPRDYNEVDEGRIVYYDIFPRHTYSIILTNAAFMPRRFLEFYWVNTPLMLSLRAYVDEVTNCDDLLMAFVAANLTGGPPMLLQPRSGRALRTVPSPGLWNRDETAEVLEEGRKASRRPSHWEQRPLCIARFLQHWPLYKSDTSMAQWVDNRAREMLTPDEPYEDEGWHDEPIDLPLVWQDQ